MKNPSRQVSGRAISFHKVIAFLLIFFGIFYNTNLKAAALSGTYTICSSGCDYSDFSKAIADLNANGVSGAVTFNVQAGTYPGAVMINSITGASSTNTITFNGAGMNSTMWSSSGTYALYMNGTQYVSFKNIQFKLTSSGYETIYMSNTGSCSFNSCRIIAPIYTSSSTITAYGVLAYGISSVTMTNCRFDGSYYALYYSGAEYCNFTNNRFIDFYEAAIYCNNGASTGNEKITGNTMDSAATNYAYGILLYNEQLPVITNNWLNNCSMWVSGVRGVSPGLSDISNNIVNIPNNSSGTGFQISLTNTNKAIRIAHNTIYLASTKSVYLGVNIYSSGSSGIQLLDNIFDIEGTTTSAITIAGTPSDYSKLDGNDYYTGSGTSLSATNIFGTLYTTLASLQAALQVYGFEKYGSSMKPSYVSVSTNDLHLNKSAANPFGIYAGIDKDIDGDPRCKLFPSAGADESSYGKTTKPTAKFYGPDTVYYGSPAIFYNAAKAGAAEKYNWYVNNTLVSDSIDLSAVVPSGSAKVKLEVTNCAGIDSEVVFFPAAYISKAPVADFIADRNVIKQGDIVHFNDASAGAPSGWKWSISPAYAIINDTNRPAYKYLYGTSAASQNPAIQFLATGNYKVCLEVTNTMKSGKKGSSSMCRSAYVSVVASINLGSMSASNQPKGYLYDNGGPDHPYYANSLSNPMTQGILIDGCADSTYLVFRSFGTYCGYDYVNVYDGKDNGGKSLIKSCSGGSKPPAGSGYYGNGPGYTGGGSYPSCTYTCMPNLAGSGGKVDTFRAGKQMYVEMRMYPGFGNPGSGFEAYWWTKPTTTTKPKAKFSTSIDAAHDSVCANASISFFNNSTGTNLNYLWDLNNNLADGFESIIANPVWAYPAIGEDTVTLITVNCGGADTFTKVITVSLPKAPKAGFTVDDADIALNEAIFLKSRQATCIDSYVWKISKTYKSATDTGSALYTMGTDMHSANPTVAFTDTGYYTVMQTVKNVNGADSIVTKAFIHVRAGYCTPYVSTILTDIGISYVGIQNISNKSGQGVADYTSYVNNRTQTAFLQKGFTYTVTVKRDSIFYGSINRTIYADWQHDGNFVRAASDSNSYTNATWQARITVPKNAQTGATVMRVAVNQGSYANKPCGGNEYGEYEDYRLYIIPDTIAPVIVLKSPDTLFLQAGGRYKEPGYTATNSAGKNIVSLVKVTASPAGFSFKNKLKKGTYVLSYDVTDSLGNKAITKYRYITVSPDTTGPQLIVSGADTIIVPVDKSSSAYATLPSVLLAYDAADSSVPVVISPLNIPVNKLDTVKVQYSATDSSGNKTIVYRIIIIKDNIAPVIALKGNASVTVGVNTTYKDAGATATDNYYDPSVLNPLIVPANGVDITKLGTYYVTYTLTDPSGNKAAPVKRTVTVVDTTAPHINIKGNVRDTMEVFDTYNDPGISAADNYYSGVATSVKGTFYMDFPNGRPTKLGVYTIVYIATDGSGNTDSVVRYVAVVDRTSPVITMLGDSMVTICRWADYRDSGYRVSDNYYSEVKVDTEGTFITKGGTQLPGIYNLRFRAIDGSGNVSFTPFRILVVLSDTNSQCKTGIKQGLAMDKYINVYPNPTNGKITISADLPDERQLQLMITNSLGQRVGQAVNMGLGRKTYTIDLSAEAAGLYILNVISANDVLTKQILLTK
jgi:PKD repeat protein